MTMSNFWDDYPKLMQPMFDGKAADTRPADARALANKPWRVPKNMAEGWRKHFAVGYDGLQKEYESAIAPAEQPTTPCAAIIRDALGHAAQIVEQITSAEDEGPQQAQSEGLFAEAPGPVNSTLPRACTCHLPRAKELCQHKHECVEVQAYAMSHPNAVPRAGAEIAWVDDSTSGGRKHISDAAAPAFIEELSAWETREDAEMVARRIGVVVLTVAEHDRLLGKDGPVPLSDWQQMKQERDALRAEVERLKRRAAVDDDLFRQQAQMLIDLRDEIERLRKGRDETQNAAIDARTGRNAGVAPSDLAGVGGQAEQSHVDRSRALLLRGHATQAHSLDPRLGLPQPEGEPCEPMSAKRWRWLP